VEFSKKDGVGSCQTFWALSLFNSVQPKWHWNLSTLPFSEYQDGFLINAARFLLAIHLCPSARIKNMWNFSHPSYTLRAQNYTKRKLFMSFTVHTFTNYSEERF